MATEQNIHDAMAIQWQARGWAIFSERKDKNKNKNKNKNMNMNMNNLMMIMMPRPEASQSPT